MELNYFIVKYKGNYEARYEEPGQGFQSEIISRVGAEIVCRGTLQSGALHGAKDITEQMQVISERVIDANRTKVFDPTQLEDRLRQVSAR